MTIRVRAIKKGTHSRECLLVAQLILTRFAVLIPLILPRACILSRLLLRPFLWSRPRLGLTRLRPLLRRRSGFRLTRRWAIHCRRSRTRRRLGPRLLRRTFVARWRSRPIWLRWTYVWTSDIRSSLRGHWFVRSRLIWIGPVRRLRRRRAIIAFRWRTGPRRLRTVVRGRRFGTIWLCRRRPVVPGGRSVRLRPIVGFRTIIRRRLIWLRPVRLRGWRPVIACRRSVRLRSVGFRTVIRCWLIRLRPIRLC
jgi:hypothetical protein